MKNKRIKQLIAGLGFGIIGIYMISSLKNPNGIFPFMIGLFLLLWRFKNA